jgi:hypothetical protein
MHWVVLGFQGKILRPSAATDLQDRCVDRLSYVFTNDRCTNCANDVGTDGRANVTDERADWCTDCCSD